MRLATATQVLCTCLIVWTAGATSAASAARNVVLFFGERLDMPGLAALDADLVSTLKSKSSERIELYREEIDLSRFGSELFRASPRQADLMIVSGRVAIKMAPVLRQIYDQMPEPKWVIAMGACASSAGMFNNYAIVQSVDKIVPVDIYCSARSEVSRW